MKKCTALIVLACLSTTTMADEFVSGYVRRDGTYVAPHMRSSPDGNRYNNYSAQGNVNPYTGQQGTVNPPSGYQQSQPQPAPQYREIFRPPQRYGE